MSAAHAYLPAPPAPAPRGSAAVPVVAALGGASLAHQAARAQALLDRIASVSNVDAGASDDPATVEQLLHALDAREALLTDLEPVVAELSSVRGQLGGAGPLTAEARALDLVLAPVEQAAQRALSFHEQLVQKVQAMRDELLWEMDRLTQLQSVAHGYLGDTRSGSRLDVRR
ncbi:MAG TPA: hypothetical protein VFS08_01905 [Gemmatimonadaceae bacterium]|nr:hypothetical protein [Gemmatimonadaceae bacterium]